MKQITFCCLLLLMAVPGCRPEEQSNAATSRAVIPSAEEVTSCKSGVPEGFSPANPPLMQDIKRGEADTSGMVRIPAGTFIMGGNNEQARQDEFPRHRVSVKEFWMDTHEVTNAQFQTFVAATGYETTAERNPDWEEIRKQLPPGTPKPPDSLLVAGSLVFTPPSHRVSLHNPAQWWRWVTGADWRHPEGPGSSIAGRESEPVVHVSWDDAAAYAYWAGKRLPTEAEWEWAARGGQEDAVYPWGNEPIDKGKAKANSWQGTFPFENNEWDGYGGLAPVKTFPANAYGLYDMAGNVWEWCADWYHADYYQAVEKPEGVQDPAGPSSSFDPMEPGIPKKVVRGGSFLCNDSYCSGYRVASRMSSGRDTGLSHTGFRCVMDK